jgi:predicted NBD/HSP70 family sugar kinase
MRPSTGGIAKLFGAIEAGGTQWICAIAGDGNELLTTTTFPTTTPKETIARAADFFAQNGSLAAVGIGCFGPVDVRPSSPTWGRITTTPKPGWSNVDVARPLGDLLGTKVAFDTDVNASALGEHLWGAAVGLETFCYITVGTGIGAGIVVNGTVLHGLLHPEFGHMRIPHDWTADPFPGSCPFHGDCLEGLASGEAIRRRWSRPGEQVESEATWQLEAEYLAAGIVNLICALSPERIIVGGGVMKQPSLLPLVRVRVRDLLADYLHAPELADEIDRYIVAPKCGPRAGVLGALELARQLDSS